MSARCVAAPARGGACPGSCVPTSADTATPSLRHSPTIRTYPHRGFSRARRSTSSTTAESNGWRPARPPLGNVHRRRTNSRCQRSSVAGVTRKIAHRSRDISFASAASTIRSVGVYRGRATWRRSTSSWCRNTAISTSFASGAGPNPTSPSSRRRITKASVRTTTTPACQASIVPAHTRKAEFAPFTVWKSPGRWTGESSHVTSATVGRQHIVDVIGVW